MEDIKKRTWAEISLPNIRHNYEAIRKSLPEGCRFLGVVKADAYGHGAVAVSRLLESCGADYLAVSCLDEAMELRKAGITMPVLILGHTPPQFTEVLIDNRITQTVTCLAKAEEYSEAAAAAGKTLSIHIKVDTGMSRLGFLCKDRLFEEGVDNMARSCKLRGIEAEGIYTHFAVSDEYDAGAQEYTLEQFKLFTDVIADLKDKHDISFKIRHCANSGATVNYPEMCLDMVRPGLLLYGYGDPEDKLGLKPGMSLYSTIGTIKYYEPGTDVSYGRHFTTERRTRMGVLSIGYADGLMRVLSGKVSFWSGKDIVPQCGNICMDMCMVDLTDSPETEVGSALEIFGACNDLNALAAAAGTIPYELLCSVSKRVPRVYIC